MCTNHDPSAVRDHICCDCIIEILYNHEIRSIKQIMTGGLINVWREPCVSFGLLVYYFYRLLGIKKYRYSPTKVPVLSFAGALP
jgi:hypothetical protein